MSSNTSVNQPNDDGTSELSDDRQDQVNAKQTCEMQGIMGKTNQEQCTSWCDVIPVFNFFYRTFHSNPPRGPDDDVTSSVVSLLNSIALVCALLLGVAAGAPLSFSYEDLIEADERWTDGGSHGCVERADFTKDVPVPTVVPSMNLANCSLSAMYALAFGLLLAMLAIISVGNVDATEEEAFLKWWRYMRWIVLVAFYMMCAGAVLCAFTLKSAIMITFPNHVIIDYCANFTRGVTDKLKANPTDISSGGIVGGGEMQTALFVGVWVCILVAGYAQLPPKNKIDAVKNPDIEKRDVEKREVDKCDFNNKSTIVTNATVANATAIAATATVTPELLEEFKIFIAQQNKALQKLSDALNGPLNVTVNTE